MQPTTGRCLYCRRVFTANPRVKNQRYCSREQCQRARKRRWQRGKMDSDPDYRQNQKEASKHWQEAHPHYWREYRRDHPPYTQHNRQRQRQRDGRGRDLAKMDASATIKTVKAGTYYIIPCHADLAKMDASIQKFTLIPESCNDPAPSCKQGLDCHGSALGDRALP